jgi:hypothetical protein
MKTKSTHLKISTYFIQNLSRFSLLIAKNIDHNFFSKVYKFTLLAVFVSLSSISLQAQDAKELRNYLNQAKASADPTVVADAQHLQSLISDLNASMSIKNGIATTYANPPFLSVNIDIQSFNKLEEVNPLISQVELLIIQINNPEDLKTVIDYANLTGFSNLKYVYFLCSVNCTPDQVNKLFKTANSKIVSLYLISIPS